MLVTDGIHQPDTHAVDIAIQLWNESTILWVNEEDQIVSMINIEHADKTHRGWGEVFFQHHPDHDALLPEMLVYAEEHLRNTEKNLIYIPIYDYDEMLVAAVQARGFQKNEQFVLWDSVYPVANGVPTPTLPKGFTLCSMADEGSDIDKRRKAFGVGFNHPEPKDWPSRITKQI
jgi:hypothetical protein